MPTTVRCFYCGVAVKRKPCRSKGKRYCSRMCSSLGRRRNPIDCFWPRVDKSPGSGPWNDCWIWKGTIGSGGYGVIAAGFGLKKQIKVHRLCWAIEYGPIPEGMDVLHRCDNPSCVRPTHLWLGTQTENNQDRDQKNRQAKGSKHGVTKLTEEDVLVIRNAATAPTQRKALFLRLAKAYGVCRNTIENIVYRKYWRHI